MVELGLFFISGISEVHRHFIAEVLSDFLQSETSGLGEEEVYNYMWVSVDPFQLQTVGYMFLHTWNEKRGPANDDKIVFPANITEAHWGGLEENEGGYVILACASVP